jgi:anti-anti-sigma factor
MAQPDSSHYEFEFSALDKSQDLDSRGTKVTTVKCHGNIVAETRHRVEEIFKDTPFQGHIIMGVSDVGYIDSAGLGSLMRLKLSSIKQGGVHVKFVEMTPRVLQLLKLSSLSDWFAA